MSRKLSEELSYIEKVGNCKYRIKDGFVPNMKVPGVFYVNDSLKDVLFEELEQNLQGHGAGGFLPAVSTILKKKKKIIRKNYLINYLIRLNKLPMLPDFLGLSVHR
jgi:hypothetical protein